MVQHTAIHVHSKQFWVVLAQICWVKKMQFNILTQLSLSTIFFNYIFNQTFGFVHI